MNGVRLWRPDYGDSAPDGESATDTWDCKAYLAHAAITLFLRAEAKYKAYADGRRFHLCLFARKHPKAGDFVLLRASDFQHLIEIEDKYVALTEEPS